MSIKLGVCMFTMGKLALSKSPTSSDGTACPASFPSAGLPCLLAACALGLTFVVTLLVVGDWVVIPLCPSLLLSLLMF